MIALDMISDMQLIHLKKIDEREIVDDTIEIKNNKKETFSNFEKKTIRTESSTQTKNQLKSTNQIKPDEIKKFENQNNKPKIKITSFQDIINQSNIDKEIELKYDLERNVKLVSFNYGKISISFNEKLNKNFIKNLTEKLFKWTGERWIISLSKNTEAKSVYEKNLEVENKKVEHFKKSKIAEEIKAAFPDAELTEIKKESE